MTGVRTQLHVNMTMHQLSSTTFIKNLIYLDAPQMLLVTLGMTILHVTANLIITQYVTGILERSGRSALALITRFISYCDVIGGLTLAISIVIPVVFRSPANAKEYNCTGPGEFSFYKISKGVLVLLGIVISRQLHVRLIFDHTIFKQSHLLLIGQFVFIIFLGFGPNVVERLAGDLVIVNDDFDVPRFGLCFLVLEMPHIVFCMCVTLFAAMTVVFVEILRVKSSNYPELPEISTASGEEEKDTKSLSSSSSSTCSSATTSNKDVESGCEQIHTRGSVKRNTVILACFVSLLLLVPLLLSMAYQTLLKGQMFVEDYMYILYRWVIISLLNMGTYGFRLII